MECTRLHKPAQQKDKLLPIKYVYPCECALTTIPNGIETQGSEMVVGRQGTDTVGHTDRFCMQTTMYRQYSVSVQFIADDIFSAQSCSYNDISAVAGTSGSQLD